MFIVANAIFLLILLFEQTFISFFAKYFSCCMIFKKKDEQYSNMQAISDDYYDQIHFKFLISEYERTKLEKQRYTLYIDKIKNEEDFFEK